MFLTSPSFTNGASIPAKFTCQGEDINPELDIANVPPDAQSLVLIVDDPDSPGGDFVHWMLWNIPPDVMKIKENFLPVRATQGQNSGGENEYMGPCPGTGCHHYVFHLYALDSTLDIQPNISRDELDRHIAKHKIDYAELIGMYQKE